MTAMVMPQQKRSKLTRRQTIRLWLALALCAFVAIGAVAPTVQSAYAQESSGCTDGVDADGDPCLDLQADTLVTAIFKWANIIIPVLLPLVAIGIGIQFGGNILSSIKNFFGSFRLG